MRNELYVFFCVTGCVSSEVPSFKRIKAKNFPVTFLRSSNWFNSFIKEKKGGSLAFRLKHYKSEENSYSRLLSLVFAAAD